MRDAVGMALVGPPQALVDSLVGGPSLVTAVHWHDEVTSTMTLVAAAADEGAPAGTVVLADVQTAGRGRRGRVWSAPAGSSLMGSWLLRPAASVRRDLIPLAVGVAMVDVARGHVPGAEVAAKWPNDLLIGGAKCAGVLAEARADGAVIVGIGVNTDWRGVPRPPELSEATSLAEAAGAAVDRWRVLAGLAGTLTRRLDELSTDPDAVVVAYRERCATLGRPVRVHRGAAEVIVGTAIAITADGHLEIAEESGRRTTHSAGDVVHLR